MGFKEEQFVNSVDKNLFCSICHEVFEDPVSSCKYGHTFCKDCIEEWLEINRTCPLDYGYMAKKNLVPQFTVKKTIENLEVYCQPQGILTEVESGLRCDWVGKLQNLRQHRQTCPFQEVRCPNLLCNQKMQRREMEHHKEMCDFRKVECGECGVLLFQNAKEEHIRDNCLEALVLCPNRCTDTKQLQAAKIKRVDLEYHINNICPKTMIFCPFKDQGCSVQVERQHVDIHVQDNMAAHMMLLAKQCSSLTKQNSSLAKENMILSREFSELAEEFSELNEEFSELNLRCSLLTEKNRLLQEELRQVKNYTWTINDFPTLTTKYSNGSAFTSPIFWLLGHRLSFLVYPNGVNEKAKGWLSLYLNITEEYPNGSKTISKLPRITNAITVKYRLSVKSIKAGFDDVSRELTNVFKEPGSWGWPDFIWKTMALSAAYCSSTNGSLTIKCTIEPDEPQ